MAVYRDPVHHPAAVVDENDLKNAILERLYNNEALRQSKAAIRVTLMGGIARLTGNVRTQTHIDMATASVRRTPGVRDVRSELIADSDIERKAALKLALDPDLRLTSDQVTVTSLLGSVMLNGKVETEAKKAAALDLMETVAGVWEIVDALEVSATAGRRAGGGVAETVVEAASTTADGHGPAAAFVPEWPRKTKAGKVATPLSAAARARIGA